MPIPSAIYFTSRTAGALMTRILIIITVGLWWIVPSLAGAQDSSKVIAMENLWNRAELNNDAPAVRLLLADDFVMTVA